MFWGSIWNKALTRRTTQIKFFNEWLSKNPSLGGRLIFEKRKKNHIELKYSGIIPELKVIVSECCISISVTYKNYCWDTLTEFDALVERDEEKGYYCSMCTPDKRQYYLSLEDFFIRHNFEDFKDWTEENIHEMNYLMLTGSPGSTTCAHIATPASLNKMKWNEHIRAILSLKQFHNT